MSILGAPGWHSRLSVRLQPGHDLAVREFEPRVRLRADGSEPGACFRFCVSLSLCPSPVHALSLSVPKIDKRWKKIKKKKSILPKAMDTFNAIPIKITPAFLTELEQTTLKFVGSQKRPQIAKVMLKKKTKVETWLFWMYGVLESCIHQDSMYRHRNGDRRQWNRIWNPEIYPQT